MTSYQRRCDVITSHRRWYDVILTLCAHWDSSQSQPKTGVIWLKKCWKRPLNRYTPPHNYTGHPFKLVHSYGHIQISGTHVECIRSTQADQMHRSVKLQTAISKPEPETKNFILDKNTNVFLTLFIVGLYYGAFPTEGDFRSDVLLDF